MSEPHTADLATRYRYREEGRQLEIERRNAWLNRVQTMYEEKANIWYEGYEMATNDIIKLIEEHALDYTEITCDFSGHGASFDEQGFIALIKGGEQVSWTNAELYALARHSEVCKKWFHGKKCIQAGLIDVAFYGLIKGENK